MKSNIIKYNLFKICLPLKLSFFFLLYFSNTSIYSQNCPTNLDFETGTFSGWKCYIGRTAEVNGQNVLTLNESGPIPGRHTMLTVSYPGETDPYGDFPVNCPNGSGHSIRLGNDQPGTEAEGVSYEFTIPSNQNEYTLIYNYAVVFEDPSHEPYQQPRMEIEITNVTDGDIIECSYNCSFRSTGFCPHIEI